MSPRLGWPRWLWQQVFELVRRIRAEGLTVLIVEQNVQQVLDVVDRAYLLEVGNDQACWDGGGIQKQRLHPQIVHGAVASEWISISLKRSSTASCSVECWRCWRSAST